MKSNKFKSYLILCVSVLISAIIGYYLDNYFDSILVTLLVTCTLAIILSQLFELSLSQLKNRRESADESIYSNETIETIKKFEEQLKAINPTAQLYILHWTSKQFISLSGGDAFSAQHSLVYASQKHPQIINLQDVSCLESLPEVMSLDIQDFLKSKQMSSALPLHTDKTIFGFILMNIKNKQQSDEKITDFVEHSSQTLSHLLQQDAITNSALALSHTTKQPPESVPWQSKVTLVFFCLMTIWWLVTALINTVNQDPYIFDFTDTYGFIAVWGGIWGIIISTHYKKQKNFSKAILFFAIGLLLQEFGQLSYAAYWNTEIPYPSIGDIGYFGSVLYYILGVIFLAESTGTNFKLHRFKNQIFALIIPILMLSIGYLLFLSNYQFDWSEPLRIFLDFGYPFFQAIYVSMALLIYLLHINRRGYTRKHVLLLLIALIAQFICDYIFLYQVNNDTWFPNGINDYMYFCAYTLMTIGILQLHKASSQ